MALFEKVPPKIGGLRLLEGDSDGTLQNQVSANYLLKAYRQMSDISSAGLGSSGDR